MGMVSEDGVPIDEKRERLQEFANQLCEEYGHGWTDMGMVIGENRSRMEVEFAVKSRWCADCGRKEDYPESFTKWRPIFPPATGR